MKSNLGLYSLRTDALNQGCTIKNRHIYGEVMFWAPELCHILSHLLAFTTEKQHQTDS